MASPEALYFRSVSLCFLAVNPSSFNIRLCSGRAISSAGRRGVSDRHRLRHCSAVGTAQNCTASHRDGRLEGLRHGLCAPMVTIAATANSPQYVIQEIPLLGLVVMIPERRRLSYRLVEDCSPG